MVNDEKTFLCWKFERFFIFQALAEQSKGIVLMAVLVFIGFIRGAVILNINLSVSECCSLKKLPHAYGLFMVSKGLFSLALSPLVGKDDKYLAKISHGKKNDQTVLND